MEPILTTKLRPPRMREGLIERWQLVERLRAGRSRTLTLVSAPAGYGKTTLLAQWEAADRERTPFVWVALDERDSDPIQLWSHVIGGLHAAHGPAGEASLGALAGGPPAIGGTVVPLLIEELADSSPLVLVLDDWHAVKNPFCDQTMALLVERAPEAVQIVVSSRSDPGLRVARLRAHGELAEVRARDLRLSSEEAADLFRRSGVAAKRSDVERLTARTEGWLAGLCLALLVVKDREDPRRFITHFSGDSRHVLDYLARDVLDAQPAGLRDFLLRSSLFERLSAPLCDAVLERSDSAARLAEVERANLFLVSLDESGTEYRYHQLFAAMLRRELEATDPDSVLGLHARASLWFEENGDSERAIDHAIASRDVTRASTLVTRMTVPLLSAGRMVTVNRWLEALSWREARADRQLAAFRALTARLSGKGRDEVERWLAVAEDGPDFGPLANGITSLRSAVAMVSSTYLSRGIRDAERAARFVLESEPAGSEWRYAGLVPLGQALFFAGRREEARAPLEEARTLPGARRRVTTVLALAYLALIELADGDAARSERLARDALALAEEIGHAESVGAANPHLALGCALMHGPDLPGAIGHLERAAELAGQDVPSYWHVHALLHLAAARHRLGDDDGAQEALGNAQVDLDELPDMGMLEALHHETSDELVRRRRRDGHLGEPLSDAELRVLQLLVEGSSVAEVARKLWLSSNTVKTHRRSIYRKLGASTREEMLERTAALGIPEDRPANEPTAR